jgi:hypothetical protein
MENQQGNAIKTQGITTYRLIMILLYEITIYAEQQAHRYVYIDQLHHVTLADKESLSKY